MLRLPSRTHALNLAVALIFGRSASCHSHLANRWRLQMQHQVGLLLDLAHLQLLIVQLLLPRNDLLGVLAPQTQLLLPLRQVLLRVQVLLHLLHDLGLDETLVDGGLVQLVRLTLLVVLSVATRHFTAMQGWVITTFLKQNDYDLYMIKSNITVPAK